MAASWLRSTHLLFGAQSWAVPWELRAAGRGPPAAVGHPSEQGHGAASASCGPCSPQNPAEHRGVWMPSSPWPVSPLMGKGTSLSRAVPGAIGEVTLPSPYGDQGHKLWLLRAASGAWHGVRKRCPVLVLPAGRHLRAHASSWPYNKLINVWLRFVLLLVL